MVISDLHSVAFWRCSKNTPILETLNRRSPKLIREFVERGHRARVINVNLKSGRSEWTDAFRGTTLW
jgi:hypothetical protein